MSPSGSLRLTSKDILLLFLYFAEGYTLGGRTRIVKMVFLFEKEVWDEFKFDNLQDPDEVLPEFSANKFGPFSGQIYDDLNFLDNLGFISSEVVTLEEDDVAEGAQDELRWRDDLGEAEDASSRVSTIEEWMYRLTDRGQSFVKDELLDELSVEQEQVLEHFIRDLENVPLKSILHYVYRQYPDYATESQIKHRFDSV